MYVLLIRENCINRIILKKIIKYTTPEAKNGNVTLHFYDSTQVHKFTLKLTVLLDGCIFMQFTIYDFEIGWFHFYIHGLANILVLNIYFKVNNKVYIFLFSCRMYSRE